MDWGDKIPKDMCLHVVHFLPNPNFKYLYLFFHFFSSMIEDEEGQMYIEPYPTKVSIWNHCIKSEHPNKTVYKSNQWLIHCIIGQGSTQDL